MTHVLVLLQGSNPVPNWATAAFLLDRGQHYHLARPDHLLVVTSPELAECYQRLRDTLRQTHGVRDSGNGAAITISSVEALDADDGESVGAAIQAGLEQQGFAGRDDVTVHLDYTGGTKVMSVMSAHPPREWQPLRLETLSYLTAQGHRFSTERRTNGGWEYLVTPPAGRGAAGAAPLGGDLRAEVQLTLDQLVKLHGVEVLVAPTDQPELERATTVAESLLISMHPRRDSGWPKWVKDTLRPRFEALDEQLRAHVHSSHPDCPDGPGCGAARRHCPLYHQRCPTVPWPAEYAELANKLSQDLGLDLKAAAFVTDGRWSALSVEECAIARRFCQQGGWFERVIERWTRAWLTVHHQGRRLKQVEVTRNPRVWTGRVAGAAPAEADAEIDVLAVIGYQLLAISCTTSLAAAMLLQKATEVWFRTQQLGGEEARPVVVSLAFSREVDNARENLQNNFGAGANVEFIGRDALGSPQAFGQQLDTIVRKVR